MIEKEYMPLTNTEIEQAFQLTDMSAMLILKLESGRKKQLAK